MKSSVDSLFYAHLLLFTAGVNGVITDPPLNAVAEVGQQAIFTCTSSSTLQNWIFSAKREDLGTTSAQDIVLGCMVQPGYTTHYEVDRPGGSSNACSLIVKDTTMQQAGVYTCSDSTAGPSALLTVIDPQIDMTVSTPYSDVVATEQVNISCSLRYNGSQIPAPTLQPYFNWMSSSEQTFSISYSNTTLDLAKSQITVTAGRKNITSFSCDLYFSLSSNVSGYASNTPTTNLNNNSFITEVLYYPGNISITSSAEYGCIYQQENLTCVADANPLAGYKWLDLNNNTITSGSVISITTEGPYECIAYNYIRNQTHNDTMTTNEISCSSSSTSLACIAIPIYFGLCCLLGLLFPLHYGKSKRKDIYNKRFPFLIKMLPCQNKVDSDKAHGGNWGWLILYIVMVIFVGLFVIPIIIFTVQCSKAEKKTKQNRQQLIRKRDNQTPMTIQSTNPRQNHRQMSKEWTCNFRDK